MAKPRILSGMRPSGRLHLGNYVGALKRWVEMQDEAECFYMAADWHALTTDYDRTDSIRENIREMTLDWLAAGLDPKKSVIFRQSEVKEHAELALLLGMITPLGWLERNPTYKEQLRELKDREIQTHGFLGYPVLQAADILAYKATHVPVGEDQLAHLELTREIARRFNHLYGETFPEPQAMLSPAPKVPGLDGRKMSKSYDNTVLLSDSAAQTEAGIKRMFTDPQKIREHDKGHPEGCVVFAFHKIYSPHWKRRETECREGAIGCVACKKDLAAQMLPALEPLRAKRRELEKNPKIVDEILEEGSARARKVALQTLEAVRSAMKIS